MYIIYHRYNNYVTHLHKGDASNVRKIDRLWIRSPNVDICQILPGFNGNYGAILLDLPRNKDDLCRFTTLHEYFEIFHSNAHWLEICFHGERIIPRANGDTSIVSQFFKNNRWLIVDMKKSNKDLSFRSLLKKYGCQSKVLPQFKSFSVNFASIGICPALKAMLTHRKFMKLLNVASTVQQLSCLFLEPRGLSKIGSMSPGVVELCRQLTNVSLVKIIIKVNKDTRLDEIEMVYLSFLVNILLQCIQQKRMKQISVIFGYAGCINQLTNNTVINIEKKEHLSQNFRSGLIKVINCVATTSYEHFGQIWNDYQKRQALFNKTLVLKENFQFERSFDL